MKQVLSSGFILFAVLTLAVFFTVSCNQDQKNAVNAVNKAENTNNSFVRKTGSEWPSFIPSDVPEFNRGTMVGKATIDGTRGHTWSLRYVGLELGDLDKYGVKLKAQGFKTNVIKGIKGGMVTGEKDNEKVTLTVSDQIGLIAITDRKE